MQLLPTYEWRPPYTITGSVFFGHRSKELIWSSKGEMDYWDNLTNLKSKISQGSVRRVKYIPQSID